MNNGIFLTITLCLAICLCTPTWSAEPWSDVDFDFQDLGPQNIGNEPTQGPFNIELLGDWIGKAKVECPGRSNLEFDTALTDLSLMCYFDACNQEGVVIGLDYMWTRLHWDANPFFNQENYNSITATFAGFSQRLPNWTWRTQLSINFDNLKYWTFANYMNYDLLLWGRYAINDCFGIHLGFLALTGMKVDRCYPVLGIDWTINQKWKINAIFPIDLSLVYTINPAWNIMLAGRFFNQRHRVGPNQTLSEAVWFYTTAGTEAAINYSPTPMLKANLHGGVNWGGHIKIANRHYHKGRRFPLGIAPYAGAEIDLNF